MNEKAVKWQQLTAEEALHQLQGNASCGLARKEARSRFKRNGANTLFEEGKSSHSVLKRWIADPAALLLLSVAVLSLFFSEIASGGLALGVLLIWYGWALWQLWRMQAHRQALASYRRPTATVVRNRRKQRLMSDRIVVGDLILLQAGDIVPADARLLKSRDLRVRLSWQASPNESPTVTEQQKNAERVYAYGEQVYAPQYENMVYGGSVVLAGKAEAIVVEVSEHSFLGAMRQYPGVNRETMKNSLPGGLDPYLRLFGFLALIVMLPISVLGLLLAPEELTTMRIFLPICAWVASASASVPHLLLSSLTYAGEAQLFARWRTGDGGALISPEALGDLAALTDFFVLGSRAVSDGCLHFQGACNGEWTWAAEGIEANALLPLAEAFALYERGEKQLPTAFEGGERPPYAQELAAASGFDGSALDLRVKRLELFRGVREDVLDVDAIDGSYRLRFYHQSSPLSGCVGILGEGNRIHPISHPSKERLLRFCNASAAQGRRLITVIREDGHRRCLIGTIAIGAIALPNAVGVLRELEAMGVRVRFFADSESSSQLISSVLERSLSAVHAEDVPDLGLAIERGQLLVGYDRREIAELTRALRSRRHTVGVIASRPQDFPVADAAIVAVACDSYPYHTGSARQDGEDLCENYQKGIPAPQILRCNAELVVNGVTRMGGGLSAVCRGVAIARTAIARVKRLATILVSLQSVRSVLLILSILFGMAPITAAGMVFASFLIDLMAMQLVSKSSQHAPEQGRFRAKEIFDGKRTLLPAVSSGAWVLLAAIFRWTGLLTANEEPTLLFTAMLLLQLVLLFFTENGVRITRSTLPTILWTLLPAVPVLIVSACISLIGDFTELGGWSVPSMGLVAAAVVIPLLAMLLFPKK